jgi:cytochrome P450
MLTIVLVSLLIVIFSLWWYLNTKIPEKFPPGPPRYPIFGSTRYMMVAGKKGSKGSLMHGVFENVKKYGKIVGFYLGSQPWVVVADYKIMKDLLKRDEVSGRPSVVPLNEFRPGHSTVGNDNKGRNPGVLLAQGRGWREQRRFLLRNLRDFGFGKSEMEDTLLDEIEKLCNEYKKLVGKPVCLDNTLNLSIVNALWAILVGEKLPLNDPKILKIVTSFNKIVKESTGAGQLAAILPPSIVLLLKKQLKLDVFEETIDSIAEMIKNQVKAHRTTFDVDDIRDMTDLFLKEIGNTDDKDSSFYKERGHFNLINNFIDLFLAGMETTSTTLLWTFFYLLHHPDVKNKIHEELDKVK